MNVSRVRGIFLCMVVGVSLTLSSFAYAPSVAHAQPTPAPTTVQSVAGTAIRTAATVAGGTAGLIGGPAGVVAGAAVGNRVGNAIANRIDPPPGTPTNEACPGITTAAGISCNVKQVVYDIVAGILGLIVQALGILIGFLVDILITFASYNGFGTSVAVVKGWTIVRDIANMFFIVILVVSAISTIIDYDDSFNYKKVLPKLLLMALLINFSRTLIMMLVDFSQVLMLTFVNGFKAAAAGNFVNALKLNGILAAANRNAAGTTAANASPITLGDLIITYMLGIIMLVIAIGVIVIQIAFLIARILGLWVALIFSPLAFLITAVPARLKKSLSAFSEDYWSKLGSLLTGGPVMAFFLWLALAVVQSAASDLPGAGMVDGPSAGAGWIAEVGTSSEIATFIVGVALMLIGLEQATKVAGSIGSEALKNFAGKTAGFAKGAAKFVAKSPYLGAKAGLRKLDRKYDMTGGISKAGLKGLGAITQKTGIEAPASVRNALASGVVMRRQERTKLAQETADATKGMSAEEKRLYAGNISSKDSVLTGSTPENKLAWANILADAASDDSRANETKKRTGEITKALKARRAEQEEAAFNERQKESGETLKAYENELKSQGFTGALLSGQVRQRQQELEAADREAAKHGLESDDEIKQIASSRAMEEVAETASQSIQQAKNMYGQLGDNEAIGKLDSIIEKTPNLETDPAKFQNLMTKIQNDPSKIKNLSAEAKSNGKVLMALLPPGAVKETNGKVTGFDEAQFQSFLESDEVKSDKLLTGNLVTMKSAIGGKEGGISRESLDHSTVQRDKYGENAVFLNIASGGLGDAMSQASGIKVESDRKVRARNGLSSAMANAGGRESAGKLSEGARNAVNTALASGVDLPSVLKSGNNNADQAIAAHLGEEVHQRIVDLGLSTDQKGVDEAMGKLTSIIKDISDPSIGTDTRTRIVAGFAMNGADVIKEKWQAANPNQRKVMVSVMEEAAKLASLASQKAAKGTDLSDSEKDVQRFVNNLKNTFPRNENEKTPTAIINLLHNPKS